MSHTESILKSFQAAHLPATWINMNVPPGEFAVQKREGHDVLHPMIMERIRASLSPSGVMFSTIGGNAHNVLTMMVENRPFDFVSPDVNHPLNPDAAISSYEQVRSNLETRLKANHLAILTAVALTVPIFAHIESPPPIRDSDYLKNHADNYFKINFPNAQVAEPWVRLKMWTLHSRLFREKCFEYNIKFIRRPQEAVDDDGFLLQKFVNDSSATHANLAYGKLVMAQVRDFLG